MTIDLDPEQFSRLTNALQAALLLADERMTAAHAEVLEADDLMLAIVRATEAARQLRAGEKGGQS